MKENFGQIKGTGCFLIFAALTVLVCHAENSKVVVVVVVEVVEVVVVVAVVVVGGGGVVVGVVVVVVVVGLADACVVPWCPFMSLK